MNLIEWVDWRRTIPRMRVCPMSCALDIQPSERVSSGASGHMRHHRSTDRYQGYPLDRTRRPRDCLAEGVPTPIPATRENQLPSSDVVIVKGDCYVEWPD